MRKGWLLAVGLVLVMALVGLGGCTLTGTDGVELSSPRINLGGQQEGIWVSGHGEVVVVPDIATLRLGIMAQEASVAPAQAKAAAAMDRVRTALKDNGVAKKDIQTQSFSIQQVTRWDREREKEIVIGYRVSNMVLVKIREIDQTGSVIDAVAQAGGDLVRISGISFSVDDPSSYHAEAREKAMLDAQAKGKQLAKLGGVKLGKPTFISESVLPPVVPRPVFEKALGVPAPASETPISPGEMKISLNVQVVYAILN